MSDSARTDIVAALAPVLAVVPPADHPLLLALLEGWAAERYRRWSADAPDDATRAALLACADREEQIATRVRSLRPDADAVQGRLVEEHPQLRAVTDNAFAHDNVLDQYALQATGERLGAATWRAFAVAAAERGEPVTEATYLACAELEEASADVLASLLR